MIIVVTSATGDQVNDDCASGVIAFRHGRFVVVPCTTERNGIQQGARSELPMLITQLLM
jgi:hypothetical protein